MITGFHLITMQVIPLFKHIADSSQGLNKLNVTLHVVDK